MVGRLHTAVLSCYNRSKMSKSAAQSKSPTPAPDGGKSSFDETMYQRNLFMVMALSMTWQLAVAVLLPVLGGYYLDQHFGTSPILLIVGVVLALLGVIGVLMRIVSVSNRRITESNTKSNRTKSDTK